MTPSRLRYWERTRLVRPSGRIDEKPAFAFRDLVGIRAILGLIDQGVPVRRIRRSVARLRDTLPELDEPLGHLTVVGRAAPRVAARHGDALVEPDGQLVWDFERDARLELVADDAPTRLPDDGEEIANSALDWFEQGCLLDADPETQEAAITAYERAIALDPSFADAHCNLGTIRFNRGERELARSAYEEALAWAPDHVEANFNLANLLEEVGRREAALHHYKASSRADPLFADAHLNLALLYDKLELPKTARQHWRRYLQLVPQGHWSDLARERLSLEGRGAED